MNNKHDFQAGGEDTDGRLISSKSSTQIPQFDRIQPVIQPIIRDCYQIWGDNIDLSKQSFIEYLLKSVALAHQQFSIVGQITISNQVSIPQWQTIQPGFQSAVKACHDIWSVSRDDFTNQQFLSLLITAFSVIGMIHWQKEQNS